MGEQAHTQPESPLPLPKSEPSPPQPSQSPPTENQQEDPENPLISPKPPNSSKIPVRPNKLRKLSSSTPSTSTSQALTTTKPAAKRRAPPPPPPLPRPLSSANEVSLALAHLRSSDHRLAPFISTLPGPAFDSHQPPFLALTKSILYQQLAYKAGTSIYTKFVELCGGEASVLPDTVLSLTSPQLRQISVSGRKATYLYDLAHKYKTGILSDSSIVGMDDKSLFTMLSMVKGIGSWSVHMFMIFSLHRPDVLPVSDIGVRKGVQILYGLEELPRPSQMEQLCEKWRPYRSVGAWYMWRLVEGKGTPPQAGFEGINVVPLQEQMAGNVVEEEDQQQLQQHLQLLEPINSNANFGACIWGQ